MYFKKNGRAVGKKNGCFLGFVCKFLVGLTGLQFTCQVPRGLTPIPEEPFPFARTPEGAPGSTGGMGVQPGGQRPSGRGGGPAQFPLSARNFQHPTVL